MTPLFFTPFFSFLLLTTSTAQRPAADPFDLGQPKTTHLHFFFHDIRSGPNPTAIPVAAPRNSTTSGFGSVVMIDDLLTNGLDRNSTPVGRAQGFYAIASNGGEFGLLMNMDFVFVGGEFNGSTIAVMGRNNAMSDEREMPVVGGSGQFRMARGYALARTRWFNTLGDVSVEYNVYVQHFSGAGKGALQAAGQSKSSSGGAAPFVAIHWGVGVAVAFLSLCLVV